MIMKCISIMGPTATGKTKLSLNLSQYLLENKYTNQIHLISADSRQVFQGLEITSGADIDQSFNKINTFKLPYDYYQFKHSPVYLHGVSIIKPNEEWSLAHFIRLINNIVKIVTKQTTIILVGGTGLYHQHCFTKNDTLHIPPNSIVRNKTKDMNVTQLQQWLKDLDENKINSMNHSDINNPRRLVRAIEIVLYKKNNNNKNKLKSQLVNCNVTKIALTLSLPKIKEKIDKRVKKRWNQSLHEVDNLLNKYPKQNLKIFDTLGIKQLIEFKKGKFNKQQAQKQWALREFQYSKRQFTWLKKINNINWFQANDENLVKKIKNQLF